MYLSTGTHESCVRAWAAAASALIEKGDEAYNVLIDIADATIHDDVEHHAIDQVDSFLRDHDKYPISTVSNTIFPQSLYDAFGSPQFIDEYLEVYDTLTATRGWGRYFERMVRHRKQDGETYKPLLKLIEKMRRQEENGRLQYKAAYELAIYDPLRDGRAFMGTVPCLSFISFKRHPIQGLLITAVYRNHHYIARCLGNLIGLGRLQAYVASEVGIQSGPLTVVSTHAKIDTRPWRVSDARRLVSNVRQALECHAPN